MTGAIRRRSLGAAVFPAVVLLGVGAGIAADRGASPVGLWVFVLVLAGWVISLCLHEFAHSVVALAGGDVSVRAKGYLTLNPLRYTDPVFSLVIPALLLAVGGIPLPGGAVLIENHRLRYRWWPSLVSAAGPLTNLLAGIVLTLAAAGSTHDDRITALGAGLAFLAVLQFGAAILNVLPVPGLDGFGILAPFLSPAANRAIAPIRPWAGLALFAVLISVPQASGYLFRGAFALFDLFGGSRGAAAIGQGLFHFWS
ncbi:site-2 protease family protein [Nakamurella endophytica]|uniref:Site-2 protease family protein n=1 Tax=Nakamurella endophytica TaxID=1748367 RepID=A0A917SWI8_9ACTN|nr:site-2 protease family protein [Nakamurella endophytica]GGM01375.1 site-2 protease family protein [Nakamurella endophytica]